jgi:hypothetical protein
VSAPRPLLCPYHVTPWAELGIGDTRVPTGQAVWDRSRWDQPSATWAGTEPTWLDRSCEVIDAHAARGRERMIDRFSPGTADVTFRNVDGWADLAPAPHPPATLPLRPGRQLRFGVDTATGRHVLYRGYVDEAVPVYDPYGLDVVTCNAIDAFTEAGRASLAELTAAVGDGETADVRIARILDAIGWPNTYRALERGAMRLQSTVFGAAAVDLLGEAAEGVGGTVYGDLEGRVVYRGRDWQTYTPGTPPAATIGNVDPDGDICPSTWELSWRRRDVAAYARMGRTDGVFREAFDQAAAAVIGPEPFVRDDLTTYDPDDLATLAARALATRGLATMPRIEAVTLDAARDPGDGSLVELMATAAPETPTRVRCRLRTRDGRPVFDVEMFVVNVEHTITDTGRWWARFTLDAASPYAAAGGRWDRGRWDRTTWAVAV